VCACLAGLEMSVNEELECTCGTKREPKLIQGGMTCLSLATEQWFILALVMFPSQW